MNKNKSIRLGIIVAILLLTIGFAIVSTNLQLRGGAGVKSDSDFAKNIKFTKCEPVNAVNVDTDNIVCDVKDEKTIEFDIPVMSKPGSLVTLEYTIKNDNTDYQTMLGQLKCDVLHVDGSALRDTEVRYITVSPNNALAGELRVGESTDTVTVKMAKSYGGNDEIKYKVVCTMDVNAEGR